MSDPYDPMDATIEMAKALERLELVERRVQQDTEESRSYIQRVWAVYSTICGMAVLSGGIAWGILYVVSGNQEVARPLSPPRIEGSTRVREGDTLTFRLDLQRIESCPAEAVDVFTPYEQGGGVHQQRRTARNVSPGKIMDFPIRVSVPRAMIPGRYKYQLELDSHCALRERLDVLATFDIEVLP